MFITEEFDGNMSIPTECDTLEEAIEVAIRSSKNWKSEVGYGEEATVRIYEGKVVATVGFPYEPTVKFVQEEE